MLLNYFSANLISIRYICPVTQ